MFKDKNILVTGGSGMIGRQLVTLLLNEDANIHVADLNKPINMSKNIIFHNIDLKDFNSCKEVCADMDYVFNLVGIKCSPQVCIERPADIMGPMLQFNTNMLEAAMLANVKWYLYTSTVGVYEPAEVLYEDDVWKTQPSKNDWYGGWAKRMGELQCQAYEKQFGKGICSIVRPANVYGPYDNFDPENAMVIPSLIHRAISGERPLNVWGDGSPVRDFIHSEDVAEGMIRVVELGYNKPINLGSGDGVTIKKIAETISNCMSDDCEIIWDTSKPSGDKQRIMNTKRAESLNIKPKISLSEGIKSTIKWYNNFGYDAEDRYNAFTDKLYKKN
jgi:GDP-L-fucose synthase